MRWSELARAVVPRQTVVSVEISDSEGTASGVAALTRYPAPEDSTAADSLEASLSDWLGAVVEGVPRRESGPVNPYDPRARPLNATVELAALDALGRAVGLPAAAFLGGVRRTRLEAYASLPSFATVDEAVECAAEAVAAGFRAVKFHASGHVDVDLATIREARGRLPAAVGLIWDASCAYDLYSAGLVASALAEDGFLWFEAPVDDDAAGTLSSLARRTPVPLVPDGMGWRSPSQWARGVSDAIWGALRLDVTRASGMTDALQVLRLSEAMGVPCEIQSYGFPLSQHANLQLMLTTRACRFFEAPFPPEDLADELAAAPSVVEGYAFAPTSAGLGHGVEAGELEERCTRLAHVSL